MQNLISTLLIVLCLTAAAVPAAAAKTRRTSSTAASSSKAKKTKVKTAARAAASPSRKGKPSTSASARGKKGSKRQAVQTAAVRRAPRQSEPTTERYMEIQQALADKGFQPGPVNGQWGPEWVAALKQFQQAQSLSPDGKLGALSLIALGLGPKRESMAHLAGKPEPAQ